MVLAHAEAARVRRPSSTYGRNNDGLSPNGTRNRVTTVVRRGERFAGFKPLLGG